MTREHKYRVWHKEEKKFVSLWAMGWRFEPENGQVYVNGMNVTGRVEMVQYTGLKDRNDKEIYEGDIVRQVYPGYEYSVDVPDIETWAKDNNVISYEVDEDGYIKYQYAKTTDVVVMDRFPIYWLKNESFGYEGEDLITPSDCEVIGNIYENGEVLDKE